MASANRGLFVWHDLAGKLGGRVYKEPTDIPTVGRSAVLADPQGARISVFTPVRTMTFHDPSKDGKFCWNDLLTSDSAAAFRFHSSILDELQKRLGGMMTTPKGAPMPPMWFFYVTTSDLEAADGAGHEEGRQGHERAARRPGGRVARPRASRAAARS